MVRTPFIGLLVLIFFGGADARSAEFTVLGACTPAEKWEFGREIPKHVPPEILKELPRFLRSPEPAFRGYAEGLALGVTSDPVVALFSQYWIGRAFHKAGLYGPAITRFNKLLEEPPSPTAVPLQVAAMACLEQIHSAYPVPVFSDGAMTNLPAYFKAGLVPRGSKPVLWEAGVHLVLRRLANHATKEEVTAAIKLLGGAGHYEEYAKALWAVAQEQPEEAELSLSSLVFATDLPPSIKVNHTELRLLLARVLYEQARYAEAARALDTVSKSDNGFVQALNLRTWVELGRDNFSEAVGASFSLQSSVLKNTFAPEALVVAAVSLHELCQFPAAVRTIGTFKKSYERTYQWLREHAQRKGKPRERLYSLAAAYLKGERVEVPVKILSEWIRSPSFIRHQQAINVSFAQTKSIPALIWHAEDAIAANAAVIASFVETTDPEMLQAASDLLQSAPPENGEPDRGPASVPAAVVELKNAGLLQEGMTDALPKWKAELEAYRTEAFGERHRLMERIELQFIALNERMLAQLEETVANAEILEAETFERASQDMVWQNAHSDFSTKPMTTAGNRSGWKVTRGRNGREEVWEDELGPVKAGLQSQCPPVKKKRKR